MGGRFVTLGGVVGFLTGRGRSLIGDSGGGVGRRGVVGVSL